MNPVWHFVNGVPQVGPLTIGPSAVTSAVPVRVADGTAGSPGYSFTNDGDGGFFRISADVFGASADSANVFRWQNGRLGLSSATALDWASDTSYTSFDVSLSRGAANRLDLASGDSLRLVDGSLTTGTTTGTLISNDAQAVANDAVISISDGANNYGLVTVTINSDDTGVLIWLRGTQAPVIVSDPSSLFSITVDTAAKVNIYYSSGYKLQNKLGSSRNVRIVRLGI